MASDAPPSRVMAGDTWTWLWASPAYPPSGGWNSSWRVIGTGIALDIAASAEGAAFRVTASAATTAALTVAARGVACQLYGWVSRSGERFAIHEGALLVLPNPATATGDLRGHAARTLAAIEALLEGRATKDQQSYRIGDRELARIPIEELMTLRDYYRAEARREADAAALASGQPRRRMIHTRMARA
jgi:hypothetical protein